MLGPNVRGEISSRGNTALDFERVCFAPGFDLGEFLHGVLHRPRRLGRHPGAFGHTLGGVVGHKHAEQRITAKFKQCPAILEKHAHLLIEKIIDNVGDLFSARLPKSAQALRHGRKTGHIGQQERSLYHTRPPVSPAGCGDMTTGQGR